MADLQSKLYDAIMNRSYYDILVLLDQGINLNLKYSGDTMLSYASAEGFTDIVQLLLARGANVDTGGFSWTPLMRASKYGHKDTVIYLLKHGADPNKQRTFGKSCLHIVRNIEIAKILLDANCDIKLVNSNKMTASEYARTKGRHEIADLIEQYEFTLVKEPDCL